MIKAEKCTVEFEGDRLMVLSDFALIVKALLDTGTRLDQIERAVSIAQKSPEELKKEHDDYIDSLDIGEALRLLQLEKSILARHARMDKEGEP